MLAGRILTGLAAVAMLAVVVLGLAPNPGSSDSGPAHVNCGTVFIDTGWSGEEGCDTQFALRFVVSGWRPWSSAPSASPCSTGGCGTANAGPGRSHP